MSPHGYVVPFDYSIQLNSEFLVCGGIKAEINFIHFKDNLHMHTHLDPKFWQIHKVIKLLNLMSLFLMIGYRFKLHSSLITHALSLSHSPCRSTFVRDFIDILYYPAPYSKPNQPILIMIICSHKCPHFVSSTSFLEFGL